MRTRSLAASPLRAGLLAAGLIVLVVAGSLAWPRLSFGQASYTAEFARSAGLKVGDDVRIAGISVGKVRSIELAGDHVEVGFGIEDDIHLGSGTRAEVKLATLLGSTFLEIEPDGAGALEDWVISLRNTFVTFQLQDVIEGGTKAAANLDAKKLRAALAAVSDSLPDNPETVGRTLDGLGRLADIVNSRDEELDELLTNVTSVASTLHAHGGDVTALMKQTDTLLKAILVRKQAVHDILVHVEAMARNLSGMLAENQKVITPLLDRLNQVTGLLKQRNAELDKGLRILGATSRYLTNATGNGPFVDFGAPYAVPDNALCATGIIKDCR